MRVECKQVVCALLQRDDRFTSTAQLMSRLDHPYMVKRFPSLLSNKLANDSREFDSSKI